MSSLARIEELEKKFGESPRRFFAPLANEYRKAGDTARAIELCRAHLEQQPNHMSGQVVLGQALFDGGFKQEAREAFELALTLDPENLIALRHLGDMAKQGGDFAAAKRWYMHVLDVDSRNHEVMTVLREIDEIINAGTFATPERGEPVVELQEPVAAPAQVDMPVATVEESSQEAHRIELAITPEIEAVASEPAETGAAGQDSETTQSSAAPEGVVADEMLLTEVVVAEVTSEVTVEEIVVAEGVAAEAMAAEAVAADERAADEARAEASTEEPVAEAVAEFWSAEEPVSPAAAEAQPHDPFSWLDAAPDSSNEQPETSNGQLVEEVEAASEPLAAESDTQDEEDQYSAVTDAAPEVFSREVRVEQAPDVADAPEVFSREAGAAHAPEAADETDFATSQEEEEDLDDALLWESHTAEFSASVSDDTPSEWDSEFDVANDPKEVELQREIAAGLDWPDSVVEDPAEAGAADMSHMDILEGGDTEEMSGVVAPTPAVFITETMAQLYEQQGYFEMSAAVYRQLSEKNPDSDRFRERIAELDRRIAGRTEPARELKIAAAEEGDSARDFFSSLVRVPLRPRLARPYVSARSEGEQDSDSPGASILDAGRPAREASSALSLESVFRNGGGTGRSGSGFSFDQFFVTGGQAPPSGGTVEPRAARQRKGQDSEEIEQFNSWLEGLKRS